jgi:flagellar biosynthesis protein FlhF
MRVERYTARDSRSAMAMVRAELGADALILANRRVHGQVEITAAIDVEQAVAQAGSVARAPVARPAVSRPAGSTNEIQLKALEKELLRLRGILEQELGSRSWKDSAGARGPDAALRQRLLRMGLSRSLTGTLLDAAPRTSGLEQRWDSVLSALASRLPTARWEDSDERITAVYGGTGVGKTSTLARLAAEDIYRHGSDGVGLITLDSYRIGAQEQLASFAEALCLPMLTASDERSLARALQRLRGRRVYIDTAGMSQHDPRLREQFQLIRRLRKPTRQLLVMAASAQASQCRAIADVFGPGALSGAIISKVDEAQSLGGVLDVVISSGLPVYGFSDGQRIPDDFHAPDSAQLVQRAARLADVDKRSARGRVLRAAG